MVAVVVAVAVVVGLRGWFWEGGLGWGVSSSPVGVEPSSFCPFFEFLGAIFLVLDQDDGLLIIVVVLVVLVVSSLVSVLWVVGFVVGFGILIFWILRSRISPLCFVPFVHVIVRRSPIFRRKKEGSVGVC